MDQDHQYDLFSIGCGNYRLFSLETLLLSAILYFPNTSTAFDTACNISVDIVKKQEAMISWKKPISGQIAWE
jgi:hypothetical protein